MSIGTIFSLLPTTPPGGGAEPAAFLRRGHDQVAAGYVLYGPQTSLVLTVGAGTDIFTLDRASGAFVLTRPQVQVPPVSNEFAINASNCPPLGERGAAAGSTTASPAPRARAARNFNMRWIASMVAEAHRILVRGGVYIYPGDAREGYRSGRLRLVYEANPIAFLMEQAGGAASTGRRAHPRPRAAHAARARAADLRLARGSGAARAPSHWSRIAGEHSPLFGRRGLFRA